MINNKDNIVKIILIDSMMNSKDNIVKIILMETYPRRDQIYILSGLDDIANSESDSSPGNSPPT